MAKHQSPTCTWSLSAISACGKIVAAQQLDQGHVAGRIEPTITASYSLPSAMPHFMPLPASCVTWKLRQGIAVGRDDDAGAAPLAVFGEDGDEVGAALAIAATRSASAFLTDSSTSPRADGCRRAQLSSSDRNPCASFHNPCITEIEVVAHIESFAEIHENIQPLHADTSRSRSTGVLAADDLAVVERLAVAADDQVDAAAPRGRCRRCRPAP